MKRTIDILVSGLGLLILSPLMLLLGLAIKLNSRGPALFRQQRIGRKFEPFWIYKFRTMVEGAPARGAAITAGADPRITRVGRVLRKTKLDELPQLWNVLKGDMSLVGPRPEVPKYVEMFRDDYERILSVRPGITDPASVQFRDESEVLGRSSDPEQTYVREILPQKLALSHEYIERASLAYDLQLIARTLLRILR